MSDSQDVLRAGDASATAVESKSPSNALEEVLDFCSQTIEHPEARIRQTGTVLQGIFVGGIKDIPNELQNHPLETCGKVIAAGALGALAGGAIALEIPILTGITIGAGVTMLGFGIDDSYKRMSSDKQLQSALRSVWNDTDYFTQMKANDTAEKVLGPEAFNWGVTLPAGLVGGFGGGIATKVVAAKLLSGKVKSSTPDVPEIISNCSAERCAGGAECPETELYWDQVAENKAAQEEWKIQDALEERAFKWKIYNLEQEWLASLKPESSSLKHVKELYEGDPHPYFPTYSWSGTMKAEPVPLEYFEVPGKLAEFDPNKHATGYIGLDKKWLPNYLQPNVGEFVRLFLYCYVV
ncbi:MAG: hypothetical protein K2X29_10475, partial [Candidatus Obscuribacterales bacterium]|nr:hypothetical protein [Candidatus Obscuribacterales bacterium]